MRIFSKKTNKNDDGAEWTVLMAAAQNGDKKAYAQLLNDIQPFIKNIVRQKLQKADVVEDVMQDALMAVHSARHTYDPSRPFHSWLTVVTKNKVTDYLRQYYRREAKELENSEEVIETFLSSVAYNINEGDKFDLEKALNTLPDKQNKIIRYMKLEGYSVKETAEKLDMTESAVKVAAHRAYKALEGVLKDD